jgi:hypothetical protein
MKKTEGRKARDTVTLSNLFQNFPLPDSWADVTVDTLLLGQKTALTTQTERDFWGQQQRAFWLSSSSSCIWRFLGGPGRGRGAGPQKRPKLSHPPSLPVKTTRFFDPPMMIYLIHWNDCIIVNLKIRSHYYKSCFDKRAL